MADLFAGTGSLGIEALSRGAAHVDFIEENARQCADIRANLETARLLDRATVHQMTVERALQVLSTRYNYVLMDPPYSQPFPSDAVAQLETQGLLQPEAIVVVGHASRVPSPNACGGLERWQDRRYGDASLAFYTRQQEKVGQ